MFFNFTFRHFLLNPSRLASNVKQSTMTGLWQRIMLIFLAGLLLFSLRSLWGINTENFTQYMTTSVSDYTLARYASLLGSVIWSVIYIAFHLFGIAFVISFIIGIPFKKVLPMQLIITALLLLEKTILFLLFYFTKTATNLSFLSFGPLASTFFDLPFMIFLLNQLTLTTIIIIIYQYHFISTYERTHKKYRLLLLLIAMHLLMAIFTASIGLVPIENLFDKIVGGGAGVE